MNLQCPKFIMRNNSIGIETLPTLALFLHTSSLTFCNHLTHTMCAHSVSSVSGVSSVPGVSRQREKPNQVRSMANLQFAVLCGSRVKGFVFVSFFVHRIVRFFRYCLPKPLFFRKFAKYLHIVY